jgi:hypothetical protein
VARATKTLASGLGLLFMLAQLVLAFWPVPGKYPWLLPGVVLGVGGGSAIRLHQKDDGTPILLGMAAVVGLSGWTLMRLLGLDLDDPYED